MKKFLVILLVCVALIGLTGCKKSSSNELIGKYELIELTIDGKIYNEEKIKSLEDLGVRTKLDITSKKKGYIELAGETINFKYDNKYIYLENEKASYAYSDGILELVGSDFKYVFRKK